MIRCWFPQWWMYSQRLETSVSFYFLSTEPCCRFWPEPLQHVFNTCSLCLLLKEFHRRHKPGSPLKVLTGIVLWECLSKVNLSETFKNTPRGRKKQKKNNLKIANYFSWHDSRMLQSKHWQIEIKWKAVRGLHQSTGRAACSDSP